MEIMKSKITTSGHNDSIKIERRLGGRCLFSDLGANQPFQWADGRECCDIYIKVAADAVSESRNAYELQTGRFVFMGGVASVLPIKLEISIIEQ